MRKLAAFSGILFVLLGLGGAALSASHSVSINDSSFSPSSVTVTKGDTVKWTPKGTESHTVTAKDGSFNSDASGQCQSTHYEGCLIGGSDDSAGIKKSFSHTFNKTGSFGYTCKIHGFSGTVVVKAPVTPKPTTAPVRTTTPQTAQPAAVNPTPGASASPEASATEAPTPTATATISAAPLATEESGGNSGLLVAGVLAGVVVGGGLVALAVTRLRRPA